MKYVYATVAGLSLVALACAPAMAGDQKSKTSDTQQMPKSDSSVTVDPKTDATPTVGSGTQGSVTTDSPSASPSTPPSTPGATDSTANPSRKSDAPAGSASPQTDAGENKDKPKY
jgi:hypothetical protein